MQDEQQSMLIIKKLKKLSATVSSKQGKDQHK